MIPLNKLGKITKGDEKDFFIEVKREPGEDGAYYVFTSRNPDFSVETFDNWFLNFDDLSYYFDEELEVEWLGDGVIADLK